MRAFGVFSWSFPWKWVARGLAMTAAVAVPWLAGCTHLGPRTVARDRFDYSSAVAESWKQQTLLNIVKLRYMDLPVFVDVAQIVSGYSMETGANIGGQISSSGAVQGNSLLLGASGKFTERPTITYTPMTGQKFLRGLMTPVEPKNIFFMLQSGYAADFVLALTVESLNNVRNRSAVAGRTRKADPEFVRVIQLMREVQSEGGMGLRLEEDKAKGQTAVIFFRRDHVPPEVLEKGAEIRRHLGVPVEQDRLRLVYSPVAGAVDELAVHSRSLLQMMLAFSSYVDVPTQDLKEQRAVPGIEASAEEGDSDKPVQIHSGKERSPHAYVAVKYRDRWFWVDDRDWLSKRALTAIMFFFTLSETGSEEALPLLTIPAN